MQVKNIFDPEKMSLIDFKMKKGQIDTPENFDVIKVAGHKLDNTLQLSFNLPEKLAKTDFIVNIRSESRDGNDDETTASFHLIFIYRIENLEELAIHEKDKRIMLDPSFANALSSITYSTSRGILLTRLQGTALQNFILPIINPSILLNIQK